MTNERLAEISRNTSRDYYRRLRSERDAERALFTTSSEAETPEPDEDSR